MRLVLLLLLLLNTSVQGCPRLLVPQLNPPLRQYCTAKV
jgi:hypothetical protein